MRNPITPYTPEEQAEKAACLEVAKAVGLPGNDKLGAVILSMLRRLQEIEERLTSENL